MAAALHCQEDNLHLLAIGSQRCPAQDRHRPPVKRRLRVVVEGGTQQSCFFFYTPSTWDFRHEATFLTRTRSQTCGLEGCRTSRAEGSLGRFGAADVFRMTLMDPNVRIPSPDNFQVLGEPNHVFIEKWTLFSP